MFYKVIFVFFYNGLIIIISKSGIRCEGRIIWKVNWGYCIWYGRKGKIIYIRCVENWKGFVIGWVVNSKRGISINLMVKVEKKIMLV